MSRLVGARGDIGFVALWEKTPAEYAANTRDEWGTTGRIQDAFARGRAAGNVTYGLFNVRWSSAFAYMTFWRAPSVEAVASTIRDLEAAGDFKFARSLHVIGTSVGDSPFLAEDDVIELPQHTAGEETPTALWIRWKTPSVRTAEWPRDRELRGVLAEHRIRLLGEFESRWLSGRSRFCMLIASSPDTALLVAGAVRRAAGRRGTGVEVVMGVLEKFYRFATHFQTEFPWLTEEDGR